MDDQHEAAIPDETTPAPDIRPRPRRRARPGRAVASLGHAWTLANPGLAPGFRAERDRVYDDALLSGEVATHDVNALACAMLLINYDLREDELIRVVLGADRRALVDAVVANLLPLEVPEDRRTLTHWITTALIANGLDPEKVPADALDGVLDHLVRTGRAVPHADFTAAGEFRDVRSDLVDMIAPAAG